MKSARSLLALPAVLAACASGRFQPAGDDIEDPVDAAPAVDTGTTDADPAPSDAPSPDAPPSAAAGLLLSEIAVAPNASEMIELYNPTAAPVALRDYYLTDVPTYFRLPAAGHTVETSDFIARFPAGATIPAGGVVTVALDTAASFTAAAGVAPTYSVASATMELVAGSAPTLTNTGEPVVLFFWDGTSDRVVDVDVMIVGAPTAANALVNKSGVAIDGPDADAAATPYATDAMTIAAQAAAPASGLSTKRVGRESAATETQTGGNGVLGQDETSEQTQTTWDAGTYSALTPGSVPAALLN
ncbi:MAG: lamin tail domain-containing protein [Deltaproteobacteria bacterium]|nr:lamin tail domain-containing protein [Kofleriaceae bacterium]